MRQIGTLFEERYVEEIVSAEVMRKKYLVAGPTSTGAQMEGWPGCSRTPAGEGRKKKAIKIVARKLVNVI